VNAALKKFFICDLAAPIRTNIRNKPGSERRIQAESRLNGAVGPYACQYAADGLYSTICFFSTHS
jgi:hypothetical protein